MSTCQNCGKTHISARLCKQCAIDQMNESRDPHLVAKKDAVDRKNADVLIYECSHCGEHYRAPGLERCPHCDPKWARATCIGKASDQDTDPKVTA